MASLPYGASVRTPPRLLFTVLLVFVSPPVTALTVELVAAGGPVIPGDSGSTVTYTTTVDNPSGLDEASADLTIDFDSDHVDCTVDSCPGGSCGSLLSGTQLQDSFALTSGASRTYEVTCAAGAGTTSSLGSTASVVAPTTGNDSDSVSVSVTPEADLSVTKDDGADVAGSGSDLSYDIVVTNEGPSDVAGATLSDNFSGILIDCQTTCEPTSGCSGPISGDLLESLDLEAGSSLTFTAVCGTFAGLEFEVSNTATIDPPSGTTDPETGNNSATDTTSLVQLEADVQVTMDDGVAAVVSGDTVTYTLQVSNPSGPNAATVDVKDPFGSSFGLTCFDALKDGADISLSSDGDLLDTSVSLDLAGLVIYQVSCLAPEDVSLMINTVILTPQGTVDPVAGNNSATDSNTVTARQAELSITATATPEPALPGATLTYSVVVTNAGAQTPDTVTVEATLPADAGSSASECTALFAEDFEDGTLGRWVVSEGGGWTSSTTKGLKASDWCCQAASGDSISCQISSLEVETSPILELVTTLPSDASGSVSATFSASSELEDPNTVNNDTSVSTTVGEPLIDLDLSLSASPDPVAPGGTLTYTLAVTNNGPSAASTVTLTDFTSFETSFESASADVGELCAGEAVICSESSGQVDCCIASLDSGATLTVTLVTSVAGDATGTITNSAQVDAAETDTDASNDSASINTSVDG